VDVALTGAGGDELFGGYPRYRIAHILQKSRHIPPPLRAVVAKLVGHPSDVVSLHPGPLLAERLLARPVSEFKSIIRGEWFQPEATTQLFTKLFDEFRQKDAVRTFMEFDRHLWLADESLRLTDATTMGSGLEGRVPFLDPRIITAIKDTPSSWHVSMNQTKFLLKQAYRPLLPQHLFTLKKASFYPPLAKWIRREASPLVEEMLENPHIQELCDTDALRLVFQEHTNHTKYHLHILSSLIQLSNWFETVYDA